MVPVGLIITVLRPTDVVNRSVNMVLCLQPS